MMYILLSGKVVTLSQTSPVFLRFCSTRPLKTLREKEKLLVTSNFSFSHGVFYPLGELSAIFIKFEVVVSSRIMRVLAQFVFVRRSSACVLSRVCLSLCVCVRLRLRASCLASVSVCASACVCVCVRLCASCLASVSL